MFKAITIAFAFSCAFSLSAYGAEPPPDLAKAEALVREGRPAEAYDLLQAREAEMAGDAEFDYWLGIAALEAGKPDKATLALERALIVNPDFVGARLDLGRAYFALGDYPRARLEFKTVLEQDPPAGARESIQRYMAEMDTRAKLRQPRITGYLDGTLGYDSNVNASTGSSSVFVPLFGLNLALAPTSTKQSDKFLSLGAGLEIAVPLTDELSAFTGADARYRVNSKQDEFDQNRLDGRVGLQFVRVNNLYRASVSYGRFYLDNRYNYESAGLAVEWRHAFDERNIASLVGSHNRLRFPDPTLAGNNVNQTIVGAGWGRNFNAEGTTFVFSSAYYGNENATNDRVDGDRRLFGLRLLAQYGISHGWDTYASVAAQISDYDTENFVFAATRKDRLYELALGIIWRPQRDWSLRPQIAYTRNHSNIQIYDYDRYDLSLTLRREFR